MATSYTDNLKLALPATGELDGQWGVTVNDNITKMIEEALTGVAALSTWVANAMTITTTNGTTASGRCMLLDLSGTLSATGTVTVPTAKKFYLVRNGTTGGYGVTVTMASGTTVTVPNGETMAVFTDGTNTKEAITYVSEALTAATATSATTATTAENLKSNATTGKIQVVGPGVGTTRVITVPDADTTMLTTTNTVTVAQGGTGATTLTANNVVLGNGTSAVQFVAPSTTGNVLMSNGTTWASTAISGLSVSQGGTGGSSFTANYVLLGNGTSAFQAVAPGSSGNLLTSNGTTWASTAPSSFATLTGAETLTNKRVTKRTSTAASITSPLAWNSDNYDAYTITAQAEALTLSADSGTPTDHQQMVFRIEDNGTARALTWTTGASKAFRAMGVTLPTTTVLGKVMRVGCQYDATDSRWDVVAIAQEA